jgi:type IV pilus assembly protein PilA
MIKARHDVVLGVAIAGVFAMTAACGITRYQQQAKAAEARANLGIIAKDAASAYEREKLSETALLPGTQTAVFRALCASAKSTVPASAASIKGVKYQSSAAEWNEGSPTEGWQCLRFTMDVPQYFMYGYAATGGGNPTGSAFTATANGDLNGDGNLSTYTITGAVDSSGILNVTPSITEVNPFE